MSPEATPMAIGGLITLGALLGVAMIVAFWQTWRYDFSEPVNRPEPEWTYDREALLRSLSTSVDPKPVELMTREEALNEGNQA